MAAVDQDIRLDIEGMTCASCAMRIEKKLNKLEGVQASVNYALGTASVHAPADVPVEQLVQTVEAAGYGASLPQPAQPPVDETAGLRRRLIATWVLALPVIALSMVPAWQFFGWQWVALALTVPVVLWGGRGFHRAAWQNLRHGTATMDTLVSVGTLAALAWSVYAMVFGRAGMIGMHHHFSVVVEPQEAADAIYLEAAAGVTAFLLLGRYLEARSKRVAGAAVQGLLRLKADEVLVERNGAASTIPLAQLVIGDVFRVRPGDRVATDGVVIDGHASVDASAVTGESVPVEVGPGDHVVGGTLAAGGSVRVRATAVGADTELSRIAALVETAQTGKASVQRLADRVAGVFVPVILLLALATLLGWWLIGGDLTRGFTAAVAVLVIACPCALGLATPVALLVGTGRGAQLGILIRGPQALEQADAVRTVVLDKTGTLTDGRMSLVGVWAADGDEQQVRRVAASLEQDSAHPIATAISRDAAGLSPVEDFRSYDGAGVGGVVEGRPALLGRVGWLREQGIDVPALVHGRVDAEAELGRTAVVLAVGGQVSGVLSVADRIRPTSVAAIRGFEALGLRPVMMTGDHRGVAEAVARQLGIHEVHAAVLPQDKAAHVSALQQQGQKVAMVGDGVNDAAALATADLGIAMGSGADVASDAADLTLLRTDPVAAVDAVRLSRATLRVIRQNIGWAFAYNLAAVPLAMSGRLGPMVAGFAMAASSVLVVLNSLRLRRFR
ncbi:heavy metal translocating P-type ATPase [Branchiibius cervicis]|uniref:Heavy metal translocating P-type ATPase n=1 Tax=Branchiibius cervicis TaxID=908252 RepID=A0ABW2AXZ5_9MICO